MDTKKILLYTGGAIALGAVTFFVWSFFQKKDIPLGNTVVSFGTDSEQAPEQTTGSSSSNNSQSTATPPFVAENSNSTTPAPFNPNVNNPFQPIDNQEYSDLDALIHKGV